MEQRPGRESWAGLLLPAALILGLAVLLGLNGGTASPPAGQVSPLED